MGLFSLKETCSCCGKTTGFNKFKCKNGYLCPECFKAARLKGLVINPFNTTGEELKIKLEKFNSKMDNFKETAKVGNYISFSDITNEIYVPNMKSEHRFIKYSDILDFELIEDGETIVTKGGLGRAVAGGVLFGGVGAIVGGVTGKKKSKHTVKSVKIKITTNDIKDPIVFITLLQKETKKDSLIYKNSAKTAQEILSRLKVVTSKDYGTKSEEVGQAKISVADELIKLKTLLDEGILTQEEFNKQKEKLLN